MRASTFDSETAPRLEAAAPPLANGTGTFLELEVPDLAAPPAAAPRPRVTAAYLKRKLWTKLDFAHSHAVSGAAFLALGVGWLGAVARGECARAWWTYALRLACPRYAERARQREALRHFGAIRERDRYTALFEAASDGEAAADRDERRAVERQAPFEVLCLWRQRSLLARRRERKRSDATERSKKWWRWGSRGAADAADDDDDVRHEDLEALFHVDDEAAAAPRGFEILRLRALTGARVALAGPAGPVGELAVAAEIAAEMADMKLGDGCFDTGLAAGGAMDDLVKPIQFGPVGSAAEAPRAEPP